jgi:hypothetical protein
MTNLEQIRTGKTLGLNVFITNEDIATLKDMPREGIEEFLVKKYLGQLLEHCPYCDVRFEGCDKHIPRWLDLEYTEG